jgi:hypothetical protein
MDENAEMWNPSDSDSDSSSTSSSTSSSSNSDRPVEPMVVGAARAVVRFRAGTVAWSENMYRVQSGRRHRDDDFRAYLRENWDAKKADYNAQRRERRQEARKQMEDLGLVIRNGRPKHPKALEAVPPELAHNLNTDQLVFLSKEDVFQNITKTIDVPTDALKAYLRTPTIPIDSRPLQWGMFRFLPWKELVPATRKNYVANARLALRDAGYLTAANQALINKHLVFQADRDKEYAQEQEADADQGDLFQDVEVVEDVENGLLLPAPNQPAPKDKKTKRVLLTQNPVAVVDFMLEAAVDPWKVVSDTFETNLANGRAAGLASICYAYLRRLYDRGDYNTNTFNVLLEWSEIFRKYTSVARQNTGEKHAAQIASPQDAANTVPWDEWRTLVRGFVDHYFSIQGDQVSIRPLINPVRPHPYGTRPESHTEGRPPAPPWWNADGTYPTAPRRPNLRELRDCVMLACYSFLAPIRLDWAPTTLVDRAPPTNNHDFTQNVLVVNSLTNPTQVNTAYFGQFKNRKKFFQNPLGFPVPKFVRTESPLVANLMLAYLQERVRVGYKSDCVFPYNTSKSETLRNDQCFTNQAFGGRLADLAWDLTGKNFRETLMRRSFITWFWGQPENDPLDQSVWDKLLPRVHQTSSKVNLGYIKKRNEELEVWKEEHANYTQAELLDKVRELRAKTLTDTQQEGAPGADEGEDTAPAAAAAVEPPPEAVPVVVAQTQVRTRAQKRQDAARIPPQPPAAAPQPQPKRTRQRKAAAPKNPVKVAARATKKAAVVPKETLTTSGRATKVPRKFF